MLNGRKPSVEVGPWDQEAEQVASPLVVNLHAIPRKQVTFTPRKGGDVSSPKTRSWIKSSPRREQGPPSGVALSTPTPKKRPEALRLERVVSERRRFQQPQVAKFAVSGDGDPAAAKNMLVTEGHPYGLGLGGLSILVNKAEQFRSPRNSPKASTSSTPRRSQAWRPPLFADQPPTPSSRREDRAQSEDSHQDLFIASSFSFRSLRPAWPGSARSSDLKLRSPLQGVRQGSSSELKQRSPFLSIAAERSSDDEELGSEDYENERRKSVSSRGIASPHSPSKAALSSPSGSVRTEVVYLRNDADAPRGGARELSGESSGLWDLDLHEASGSGQGSLRDASSRPCGPNLAAAFGRAGIGVGVERETGTHAGREEERARRRWGEMRKRSYLTKRTLQLGGRGQQTQRHVASGNLRGVIRAGGSQATTIEEGVLLEGLEAQRFALAGRTLDGPHEQQEEPFLPEEREQNSPRRARRRLSDAAQEEEAEVQEEEEEGEWWTRHPSQHAYEEELEVASDVLLQCRKIRQFLFTCLSVSEDPEAENFRHRWDTFIMSAKERMQAVEAAWQSLDFTCHYLPDLITALVPDLHPRRMARNDCDQVLVLLKKVLQRDEEGWWEEDPLLERLRGIATEAVAARREEERGGGAVGGRAGERRRGGGAHAAACLSSSHNDAQMVGAHVQRVGVLRGICILHFLLAVLASPLVPDHYVPEGKLRTIWLKTCLVLKMEATARLFITPADERALPVNLEWESDFGDDESGSEDNRSEDEGESVDVE